MAADSSPFEGGLLKMSTGSSKSRLVKSHSMVMWPAMPTVNSWGQVAPIKYFMFLVGVFPLFLMFGMNHQDLNCSPG